MKLTDDLIRVREENNIRLANDADLSLINDHTMIRIENEVDDAQTSLLFILERFHLRPDRVYGFQSIPPMIDTLLDPLGMMYEHTDHLAEAVRSKASYILAFFNDGKSVVLMPTKCGYRFFCPSTNTKGFVSKHFLAGLREDCYVIDKPLGKSKTILGTFAGSVLGRLTLRDVILLLAATGLTTLLGLVIPEVNRWVYKTYINGSEHPMSGLLVALIVYLTVVVARGLITMIKTLMLTSTKIRISMEMQSCVMARVLHLPHSFFLDTSSGRLSQRINSCSRLSDILLEICMNVLLNLSFSIAYLVQMGSMAPDLFLPAFIFILIRILASVISAALNMVNETRLLNLKMEYTGFLYSAIKGIQKLKGLGAEVFIYGKWADMYRQRLSLTYKQPFFLKYSNEILAAIATMTTIALLFVSVSNGLKAEDYLTFTSSYTLILSVVSALTDIMNNMFLTKFLCRNIYPVFQTESEEMEPLEYIRNLQGSIRMDGISYSYDGEPLGCLNNITLNIRKGEKVAIVGESGCGKSTLLQILIGLIKPDTGVVYYDGKSIDSLNQKSLRRCIGSVFQFSRLFPGTLAENIAFGNEESADEEKIWEAADTAVIGDYIRSLPLKMNTEISESNSSGFSGGQRQRLLLARAFLNRPKVLILDEATSALDNVNQNKVLDNIRKMSATVVMVAHRLSTVQGFDRIIMLDKGSIIEEGTYEELMEKNARFAELVRKQLL